MCAAKLDTATRISLGDALQHAEDLEWTSRIFLPFDQKWSAATAALVIAEGEIEFVDDEPKNAYADERGMACALQVQAVQDIVTNLRMQTESPSLELLVKAFLYYYDNDAFIVLDADR